MAEHSMWVFDILFNCFWQKIREEGGVFKGESSCIRQSCSTSLLFMEES